MSDLRFGADSFWTKLKNRNPRLRAADQTDDQTHDGHGFVIVLAGGGIGFVLLTLVQLVAGSFAWDIDWTAHEKLGAGMAFANAWYLADECLTRFRLSFYYKPWDFWGDWYKPACLWLPALLGSLPLLYGMMVPLAVWYYLLRPIPPHWIRR